MAKKIIQDLWIKEIPNGFTIEKKLASHTSLEDLRKAIGFEIIDEKKSYLFLIPVKKSL